MYGVPSSVRAPAPARKWSGALENTHLELLESMRGTISDCRRTVNLSRATIIASYEAMAEADRRARHCTPWAEGIESLPVAEAAETESSLATILPDFRGENARGRPFPHAGGRW